MNLVSVLIAALLLAGSLTARAQSSEDQYVRIYNLIQQADTFSNAGKTAQALPKYLEAQTALKNIQRQNPSWNPKVVNFRLEYLADKIAGLPSANTPSPAPKTVPLPVVTSPSPLPPPATAKPEPSPEPTGGFEFYRDFFMESQVVDFVAFLKKNQVPHRVEKSRLLIDKSIAGEGLVPFAIVKLRPADFGRVGQLLAKSVEENPELLDSHYFQSFTAAELLDVLRKPDEWTAEDVAAAQLLLKKQGVAVLLRSSRRKPLTNRRSSQY